MKKFSLVTDDDRFQKDFISTHSNDNFEKGVNVPTRVG